MANSLLEFAGHFSLPRTHHFIVEIVPIPVRKLVSAVLRFPPYIADELSADCKFRLYSRLYETFDQF